MAYVERGQKELKTDWYESPKQVGEEQTLLPQGKLGIKNRVYKKERLGIG